MALLEHRATIQVVNLAALLAAIHRQATFPRLSVDVTVGNAGSTVGTPQPLRVEVVQNPLFTLFVAE